MADIRWPFLGTGAQAQIPNFRVRIEQIEARSMPS